MYKKKKAVLANMNYPTYSRGEDAPPQLETYMYNPHLKSDGQENEEGNVG